MSTKRPPHHQGLDRALLAATRLGWILRRLRRALAISQPSAASARRRSR